MANFTVVYDANVLYPASLRSILIYLGMTGMFRVRWSMSIHEEWIRSVLKNRNDINSEVLNEYNTVQPHGAINMMTPSAFAAWHRQESKQVA